MADEWHYAQDGARHGPVSTDELKRLAAEGSLVPTDSIWKAGMPEWTPASRAKGLFAGPMTPPELPSGETGGPPPVPPAVLASGTAMTGRAMRLRARSGSAPKDASLPTWSKVAGGVVAGVIALVVVGNLTADRGGRSGGSRVSTPSATAPQAAPSATVPQAAPPAVDPRRLVGSWVFSMTNATGGTSGFIMSLNPDATFGIEMLKVDGVGNTTPLGFMGGTWVVTGDRLVMTSPDGTDGFIYVIAEFGGNTLTLQDVETGLMKPMQRLPQ